MLAIQKLGGEKAGKIETFLSIRFINSTLTIRGNGELAHRQPPDAPKACTIKCSHGYNYLNQLKRSQRAILPRLNQPLPNQLSRKLNNTRSATTVQLQPFNNNHSATAPAEVPAIEGGLATAQRLVPGGRAERRPPPCAGAELERREPSLSWSLHLPGLRRRRKRVRMLAIVHDGCGSRTSGSLFISPFTKQDQAVCAAFSRSMRR